MMVEDVLIKMNALKCKTRTKMNALFLKASELTLNKEYKRIFIECSMGNLPNGITQENNTFLFKDEKITPKNEKELCSTFLKWFKKIDFNVSNSVKVETEFPSLCSLKDVPSKSRTALILDYTYRIQEKLVLTEDQRENLYSTIWAGLYCGFVNISDVVIRDYKIVDVPNIAFENGYFVFTKDAQADNENSSCMRSSQKK